METGNETIVPQFTDYNFGRPIYRAPQPAPCPFCGNAGQQINHLQQADRDAGDVYAAECACGAVGPPGESAIEAAEMWNARRAVTP